MIRDAPTTLYVDPDSARSEAVRSALRDSHPDLPFRTVGDVAEAEASLSSDPLDCVVTRSDLGDEDAVAFLSTVRERYPSAATVLYGSDHSPDLLGRAYAAGVDAFVHDAGADHAAVLGDHVLAAHSVSDDASESELRLEALLEVTPDAVLVIDERSVVRFANPAVESILGYAPDEIEGEPLTRLMPEELRESHRRGLARYLRTDERALDWDGVELPGRHRDGHEVPLSISFSEQWVDGERRFVGIARDVTERERRESQLASLNRVARTLLTAETEGDVADVTVTAAAETLDFPLTAVYLYDDDVGSLTAAARTDAVRDAVGDDPLFGPGDDLLWQVYADNEGEVFDDVLERTDVSASSTPLRSAVVFPLGKHGVFVTGATEPHAFTDADVSIASVLAATVRATLERTDREAQLRAKTEELETRTASLERVNRINDVVRDLTQTLMAASTREEIEQVVCTRLANADPYRFAWIGEQETVGGELVPKASAGVERGYLDEITVTADDALTGQGPSGRAMRTREPQVQNHLRVDPPFEPWRSAALQRGYRASIAVPLVYKETLYGLLNLYAGEPGVFDELEVSVLQELGRTVGFAINALERRKALVDDQAVELEFRIDDPTIGPVRHVEGTDGTFSFDGLVEQADGTIRVFFVVDGVDPDTVLTQAAQIPNVSHANLIAERDGGHLFEATLEDESFFGTLLQQGAHPTRFTAASGTATLTVELPRRGDIRAFLDTLVNAYDGVELVSRRELERSVQTESEFRARYKDRLTDRQEEVLRTAYLAGFFDWPRRATGSDVAEMLGVSQPTVNRHVRKGEHELFSLVFSDDEDGD